MSTRSRQLRLPTGPPFIIGVAGGTGSGKTTVAEHVAGFLGGGGISLLRLDSYYADHPELTLDERAQLNYDHPDAFDWELLLAQVSALSAGHVIEVPTYDFSTYRRLTATERVVPTRIVVVEGILVLWEPAVRALFDLKVYVDTDADVRFIRRLQRDVSERGRTPESVINQYLATVRPSHLGFVEPSKRWADVIIPHGGKNEPALDVLMARVRELV